MRFGFVCLLVLLISKSAASLEYKTLFIAELFRHGSRTSTYPDPFGDQSFTKEIGEGNLLPNGMRQHYILGQQLSQLSYPDLFSKPIKPSDFVMYSTALNRTVESGMSHLMGLYPLGTGPKITTPTKKEYTLPPYEGLSVEIPDFDTSLPDGMSAPPIVINDNANEQLFMSVPFYSCPSLYSDLEKYNTSLQQKYDNEKSDKYQKVIQQIDLLIEKLKGAGYNLDPLFALTSYKYAILTAVRDGVFSHLYYTGQYPKVEVEELVPQLNQITMLYFLGKYGLPNGVSYLTNQMAGEILDYMKLIAINNTANALKYMGFSGHDTSQVPWMVGFNMTSVDCLLDKLMDPTANPPGMCYPAPLFASNFIFELSKTDDEKPLYFVRVLYNGVNIKFCKPGKLNSDGYCDFDSFSSEFERLFFVGYEKFNKKCNSSSASPLLWYYSMIALIITLTIVLIIYGARSMQDKKKLKTQQIDEKLISGDN